ncbi:NAD(P)-dependent dehydrogenase (short-subunit alcohol dehydrogenase family) [Virgibacillus halotolerans]|uniref:SDR family NAD(P)-dependent oxidoreductase n=1 Tax=Virgibacillus halotolerans TaxID=1071053 RepID=UPI00195F8788|nr:SDR family oxidoreductase [Virgibacillus halotolerans]MBM7601575.1 NAD(P)-dependent dehydrogenase (short-subunit alcohol dehydrogenase family) [Virgibacillus halotolerans]
MDRLKDKIAIITGGASGMGASMVKLFADEGATVIAADINEENLQKIAALDNVEGMKLDVSSDEDWAVLTKAVVDRYGRIDILINNAGISSEKTPDQITEEDWTLMHKINSFGPFLGIKHVSKYMKEAGFGSIVNTCSYTAIIGSGFNHYSASKGSLRAIARAAAADLGRFNVRVNTVFPGVIETPMTATLTEYKDAMDMLVNATPMKRLGKPEEVANAILFFATDEASYITGGELVIDGGYSAQ